MKQLLLLATLTAGFGIQALRAQTWSGSGSNGSDGALNLGNNTPGVANGFLVFDPVALNLDADGDNVYHFTTITIRDNITVRFLANRMRRPGPVVFLASGAVLIAGRLDLGGEKGHPAGNNDSLRRISIPGPGGYAGGVGGKATGAPQTVGFGPGGGRLSTDANRGCPGAHTRANVPSWCTAAGSPPTYGSNLLQPLIGGSGGSGAKQFWLNPGIGGPGGGAGGGAIRISSSVHIVFGTGLSGQVAQGCNGNYFIQTGGGAGGDSVNVANNRGGSGAGGAIHLQAPLLSGCGIHAYSGGGQNDDGSPGSEGRIRLDSNGFVSFSSNPLATVNSLVDVPLPPTPPLLRVVSINGVPVPASPVFDYASPDVLINSTSPVPVVLEGNNIPVNTPITVFLTTETGADVTATANLSGTVANSTATVNVTLPLGTARLIARAIW